MMTVAELLGRAKREIESGETSLRAAAEDIAAAQEQGATQRQMAEAVGKSAAWVNRLLKWRESGYHDGTPFGPQAKASRQRARVHATEQEQQKQTTSEQAEAAAARARAEMAKADAAKAKAEARKARAEAEKAKAEARAARAQEKARRHHFSSGGAFRNDTRKPKIPSRARELLVKALGMLGSDYAGERANAALAVEKQRINLGMMWGELIIPAEGAEAKAA
jgi:hypothetical protein